MVARGVRKRGVEGQELEVERFREGHVARIVGGEIHSKFPDPIRQRTVIVVTDVEIKKEITRLFGAGHRGEALIDPPAKYPQHFDLQELRGGYLPLNIFQFGLYAR